MSDKKPLNILVIGPTGHGGSYLVIELCERGHNVTGLSRKPETIGTHPKYTPKPFDVVNCSFTELHQALSGYDVVIKYPPLVALSFLS
jgi:putative NADH-flavin reductase